VSTYLRRRGRLTSAQARALESHGPATIVPADQDAPVDLPALYGRDAPVGLEIGFGSGQALLDWAEAAPDWNLIGVEVYEPGIGALLKGMHERGLANIRIIARDAQEVVGQLIPTGSLAEVRIFFPDPWPKKRHHKRRLIQAPFVSQLADRMCPGALLRMATDWQPYAEQMLEVLQAETAFENAAGEGFSERFEARNVTRFEARGQRLGHGVWDLCYRRR
jgi:tRNA (guanine-N7-)-methyltransferase